jgi:hypothetical protein
VHHPSNHTKARPSSAASIPECSERRRGGTLRRPSGRLLACAVPDLQKRGHGADDWLDDAGSMTHGSMAYSAMRCSIVYPAVDLKSATKA